MLELYLQFLCALCVLGSEAAQRNVVRGRKTYDGSYRDVGTANNDGRYVPPPPPLDGRYYPDPRNDGRYIPDNSGAYHHVDYPYVHV